VHTMSSQGILRKPKTRRGKRILEKREPQLIEDTKKAIFLRAHKTSDVVNGLLKDLYLIKKPEAILLKKLKSREDDNPNNRVNYGDVMNDPTPVERLCYLRDCPLVAIANHTKKRPNDLTLGRLYNHHLLDLVQFEVSNYAPLSSFSVEKSASGSKPCFILSGEVFNTNEDMKTIGNLFVDFFRGQQVDQINLQGLDHVIILTANDDKTILFRHYHIKLKRSGTKIPRVELEEMGPRMDLTVRRTQFASEDLRREANRKPRALEARKKKNKSDNELNEQLGRVYVPHQEIDKMPTNKDLKKGLGKRKRGNSNGEVPAPDAPAESEESRVAKKAKK
jgi:ribosome production factor 2